MAPTPMPNGNAMPLTEYSAAPNGDEHTEASSLVPKAFLLPDGHPDVRQPPILDQKNPIYKI